MISGSQEDAQLAEVLIHQCLANQPRLETLELRVPSSYGGRLIGRGGETVRRMQSQSGCKIDIERGSDNREKNQSFVVK